MTRIERAEERVAKAEARLLKAKLELIAAHDAADWARNQKYLRAEWAAMTPEQQAVRIKELTSG